MLYTPAHFALRQRELAGALMHAHPLATLITPMADEPFVTHAPLLLDDHADPWQLHGHVARANPHWQAWHDGDHLFAIFHGGDAYVSPRLYSARKAVPTWNYAVVHVRGTVAIKHDSESKEAVLKTLIDAHDPPYHERWNELDHAFREGMKEGIVAFTITIDRVEAKFKLSQNRPLDDRERVRTAMLAGGDKGRELAAWMQQLSTD
jgi:transcriptional regulator